MSRPTLSRRRGPTVAIGPMPVHILAQAVQRRPAPRHRTPRLLGLLVPVALAASPVHANNYGESLAWQFKTAADRASQAAILDLIQKRRGGYYAAPIYNTTIAHQVNCTVAATATGNSDGQSAVANSPSVTGATSSATGNAGSTSIDTGRAGATSQTRQANGGAVTSGVTGATDTAVQGPAWQVLNAAQTNSGNQSASVEGSNACAFAALN